MARFLLYIAITFLLYQIARALVRRMLGPRPMPRHRPARSSPKPEQVNPTHTQTPVPVKSPRIDYSKVRDARYRDL
jgi:hypothetical protein